MQVLVVDDVEENCDLLSLKIKKMGHSVDCCYDGKTALNSVREREYDIMFLDISLPEMTGTEVLEHMSEEGLHDKTKVVMITATDDSKVVIQCMRKGAKGYITKPFSINEVQRALT